MNSIFECKSLTKRYGGKVALYDLDINIGRGRIVGLLGPNGSGKTTLIKMTAGLLTASSGQLIVGGIPVGQETKSLVSYLPERTYFSSWMRVIDLVSFFEDFYADFNKNKALDMFKRLEIGPNDRLKYMSKGTKEKVQLIMVMSREAQLYLLDEPIGGVDPAARDYILDTIIRNYNENATVIISTHLIADIERVLDDVIMINRGALAMQSSVDEIREQKGKSVDELFREVFKC